MKKMAAIKAMRNLDQQGVYLLTKGDLAKRPLHIATKAAAVQDLLRVGLMLR